jgi:hypothetical protein
MPRTQKDRDCGGVNVQNYRKIWRLSATKQPLNRY